MLAAASPIGRDSINADGECKLDRASTPRCLKPFRQGYAPGSMGDAAGPGHRVTVTVADPTPSDSECRALGHMKLG